MSSPTKSPSGKKSPASGKAKGSRPSTKTGVGAAAAKDAILNSPFLVWVIFASTIPAFLYAFIYDFRPDSLSPFSLELWIYCATILVTSNSLLGVNEKLWQYACRSISTRKSQSNQDKLAKQAMYAAIAKTNLFYLSIFLFVNFYCCADMPISASYPLSSGGSALLLGLYISYKYK